MIPDEQKQLILEVLEEAIFNTRDRRDELLRQTQNAPSEANSQNLYGEAGRLKQRMSTMRAAYISIKELP